MKYFNYTLLCLLYFAFSFNTKSQTLTTVSNNTILVSPSYTMNSGTTYTITGEVKNVGAASISNNVHVNIAIDTSSTIGIKKYYWRSTKTYSVTNFAPNTTFAFSVSDAATPPNGYKTTGNGVTIVVWTSVGAFPNDSTTTLDSTFTTIYIVDLTSIGDDKKFEEQSIIIQNPAAEVLSFEFLVLNDNLFFLELINSEGKTLLKQDVTTKNSTLKTHNLSNGIYYLRFTNNKTQKTVTKKIIIQK